MSDTFNFRSAFNGFHREDVVHYIEYLNAKHTAEVNQLNTQLELLRVQNASADVAALQAQLSAAQEINDQLQAQVTELERRCSVMDAQHTAVSTDAAPHSNELEARCLDLEQQLRDLKTNAVQYHVTQELEAYRRAERTEREARERAELVYRQANGALAEATVKVDEAFSQIGDMADKLNEQLMHLQSAVTVSRQALSDATASLYSIAPGTQQN
ncbi:MAG: hypothetical protein E7465_03010 [Ruminococcaceae bacterium]|nr:hypothetical protein [Oscillospiraceae bacterium]